MQENSSSKTVSVSCRKVKNKKCAIMNNLGFLKDSQTKNTYYYRHWHNPKLLGVAGKGTETES